MTKRVPLDTNPMNKLDQALILHVREELGRLQPAIWVFQNSLPCVSDFNKPPRNSREMGARKRLIKAARQIHDILRED